MENLRSGQAGAGVQESQSLFSIFDDAELLNLIPFVTSFLLINIINLWRPSTNPRLSLWCDQTYTDQFSQISKGPEEFFLYIEDLWDYGAPYTWQFYWGLRL